MKAQFMTITILVIFLLMLGEVILFVGLQLNYGSLSQSSTLSTSTSNYAQLLSQSSSDFARRSLTSAMSTLFLYEYNISMRKTNFITNLSTFTRYLVVNGTLPNVASGSATANAITAYMGNATLKSYNAIIAKSLGISSRNLTINETKPLITQYTPYSLSISYIEKVMLNTSNGRFVYTIPVNVSIPLNNTPDLFYAQQGVLRYIKFSNFSNINTSIIGNAYASNGSSTFAYGIAYINPAGSGCPSPANSSLILVTINANAMHGCEDSFGGLITYGGINTITETPTVPYLIYPQSSGIVSDISTSVHNTNLLLYGPSLAAYNIEGLRSAVYNNYYFATPFAPSYIQRVSGNLTQQSQNGVASFGIYNRLAGSFNGKSSYIATPSALSPYVNQQSYGITTSVWFRMASSQAQEGNAGAVLFGTSNCGAVLWFPSATTIKFADTCGDGATLTYSFSQNVWYNVVTSVASGSNPTVTMYVNGAKIGSGSSSTFSSVSSEFCIGATSPSAGSTCSGGSSPGEFFNGSIANVQVYNGILNSSQASQIYLNGIEGLPVSNTITGWWPLNGNANDYSGDNNNGTVTNTIFTGLPNYNRDALLPNVVPAQLQPIPGIGACTSTKTCYAYNATKLYLGSSPLQTGIGQQTVAQLLTGDGSTNSHINFDVPQISTSGGSYTTVSFWMYAPTGTSGVMPFGFEEYDLYTSSGDIFGFNTGNSDIYGICSSTNWVNRWVLVTAEFYNGAYTGHNQLYINGTSQTLSQCLGSASSGTVTPNFQISGWGYQSPGYNFGGNVSNLQVYNGQLNAGQVKTLFNRGIFGLPLSNATLLGWWPLNGNANDYSGNHNNGTAYMVAWRKYTTLTNTSAAAAIGAPTGGIVGSAATEWQATGLGGSQYVPNIFCTAGYNGIAGNKSSYFAPVLSNVGLGKWTSGSAYPVPVYDQACSSYNGYMYCVGGYNGISSVGYNNVYYAPVSSTGIGTWTSTTSYPLAPWAPSCNAYNGYIYCIGGETSTVDVNQAYYAPISSTGVGTWSPTTDYPTSYILGQSCNVYNGYLYCVGGYYGGTISSTYTAPVSSAGIGTWSSGTSYPTSAYVTGCAPSNGYLYCVGAYADSSSTYYAPLYNGGAMGSWNPGTAYPLSVFGTDCAAYNNFIYCIGGYDGSYLNNVYYAPLSNTGMGPWNATTSYPTEVYDNPTSMCTLS